MVTITPHHLKLGQPVAMLPASTDDMMKVILKISEFLFMLDGKSES